MSPDGGSCAYPWVPEVLPVTRGAVNDSVSDVVTCNRSGSVSARLSAGSGAFGGRERRPDGSAARRRADCLCVDPYTWARLVFYKRTEAQNGLQRLGTARNGSEWLSAMSLRGTLSSEEGSHARGRCHALRRYGVWEWEGEVEMGASSEGRVRDSQSAGGGQALTVTRVTIYIHDWCVPSCAVGLGQRARGCRVGVVSVVVGRDI